jgi:hypothetical protein
MGGVPFFRFCRVQPPNAPKGTCDRGDPVGWGSSTQRRLESREDQRRDKEGKKIQIKYNCSGAQARSALSAAVPVTLAIRTLQPATKVQLVLKQTVTETLFVFLCVYISRKVALTILVHPSYQVAASEHAHTRTHTHTHITRLVGWLSNLGTLRVRV